MAKRKNKLVLTTDSDLITYKDETGADRCLGYLIWHQGKAFDAEHGACDIEEERARKHNMTYDRLSLEGLDTHAEVGQGNFFYVRKTLEEKYVVETWLGTLVSAEIKLGREDGKRKTVVFRRNNRTFSGKGEIANAIFFRRVT